MTVRYSRHGLRIPNMYTVIKTSIPKFDTRHDIQYLTVLYNSKNMAKLYKNAITFVNIEPGES